MQNNKERKRTLGKWVIALLAIFCILAVNECYYLASVQFRCVRKINRGKELNMYELFCAYQMHTSLWMFGWVYDMSTAMACFNKQFHIDGPIIELPIHDDATVKSAKARLLAGKAKRIRLIWHRYNTKASIYMNGGYISIYRDETGEYFRYDIPMDYSPMTVNIAGVTICQTVFDYMERRGILYVYTETRYERIEEK